MHRASRLRGNRIYYMFRHPRRAGKTFTLLIAAIAAVLLLLGLSDVVGTAPAASAEPPEQSDAAGASQDQAVDENDGDEPPLEPARLVQPDAWIAVELTPYFKSGTPELTGECEVTGNCAMAPFFINFKKNKVFALEVPEVIEGKFEKVCKTVTVVPKAPSVKTTCTIKKTYIVKAKVVGGKLKTHNKAKQLEVISLEIQDYAEKTVTDCIICSPEGCITMPTQSKHEVRESEWWPMELYRWPVVDGHSETVGRFKYTLVLREP